MELGLIDGEQIHGVCTTSVFPESELGLTELELDDWSDSPFQDFGIQFASMAEKRNPSVFPTVSLASFLLPNSDDDGSLPVFWYCSLFPGRVKDS